MTDEERSALEAKAVELRRLAALCRADAKKVGPETSACTVAHAAAEALDEEADAHEAELRA